MSLMRRYAPGLRLAMMATDFLVTVGLFVAAGRLRFGRDWFMVWQELLPRPWVGFLAFGVVAVATFSAVGLYRLGSRWTFAAETKDVLKGVVALIVATFSLLYLFKLDQVSRLFLGMFFLAEGAGVLATRTALRFAFRAARKRGRARRQVLLVGWDDEVNHFVSQLQDFPEAGVSLVGVLSPTEDIANGFRWLGKPDDLTRTLADYVVDEVVICAGTDRWDEASTLVAACQEQGKEVRIPLSVSAQMMTYGRAELMGTTPVLSLSPTPERKVGMAIKRIIDIVGATVGLIVTSPIMAAAAVAIVTTEGRPIIFSQTRVGHHGRHFKAFKFRTMVYDAEERKAELTARNERRGPVFKVTDDPRITRIGRLLRRTSIDELPQLWNVLKGEMSLVGPRPPVPDEVELYDPWHRRRLSMKPGITGLWQVTARHEPEFDRWVELDIHYIEEWSLWLDGAIVLKTIPVVLGMTGR